MFDPMTLTPAELNTAQRTAKLKVGLLGALEDPSHPDNASALAAFAWLIARRDDPSVKYSAVEEWPLSRIVDVTGLGEGEAATEGR